MFQEKLSYLLYFEPFSSAPTLLCLFIYTSFFFIIECLEKKGGECTRYKVVFHKMMFEGKEDWTNNGKKELSKRELLTEMFFVVYFLIFTGGMQE